jgi:DNA-binding transcriptional LysR family regulator
VSGGQDLGVLRLATGDGPLRGWLAGRLDRLADALPDLRLALAGPGPAEGDAELLLTARPQPADQLIGAVEVLPLCSADAAFAGGLRRAGDVLGAPLLEARPGVWTDWARRQGLADPPAARLHADQDDLMAAAARGEGVALGDQFMAEAPVLAGDLIALPFAAAADDSVVLRWRPGVAGREAAERLVMGLRLEMARGAALIRAASRSRASRASS